MDVLFSPGLTVKGPAMQGQLVQTKRQMSDGGLIIYPRVHKTFTIRLSVSGRIFQTSESVAAIFQTAVIHLFETPTILVTLS